MLQLNPMLPVFVIPSDLYPTGAAQAFCLIDYSSEHAVLWGVAFDATGEIWWVPNQYVRFQSNRSMGRILTK
jgi:hypothetical protein